MVRVVLCATIRIFDDVGNRRTSPLVPSDHPSFPGKVLIFFRLLSLHHYNNNNNTVSGVNLPFSYRLNLGFCLPMEWQVQKAY
jgi:hypothetical protein